MYPLPGTCKTSLMNINKVSWTLILDPLEERIEIKLLDNVIEKATVCPSNWSSSLSRTWSSPIDHPVNSSTKVFCIVNWNSLNDDPVVGIPVAPPIGTVKICPSTYPYPVLMISKSITLDPCPTTILTFACVPMPEDVEL